MTTNPQPDTWLDDLLTQHFRYAISKGWSGVSFDQAKATIQSKLKAAELAGRISELKKISKATIDKPDTPENQNDQTWQGGYRFAKNNLKRYKLDRLSELRKEKEG